MEKAVLIGCGILQKELTFLIETRHWPLDTYFLPSSLHVDFEKLAATLNAALQRFPDRPRRIVCYGMCHPLLDHILKDAHAVRIPGQNCIEMLLGKERFTAELTQGAFFLLEDWAVHWNRDIGAYFGGEHNTRIIFQAEHRYLLALTTCCSADFTLEAQEVSRITGLPLRRMAVSLDHFANTLRNLLLQEGVLSHERRL